MNTVHGNTKYASLVSMEGLKVGEAMNLVLTYKALNTLRVKISVIRRKGVRDYRSTKLMEMDDGRIAVRLERVK